MLDRQPYTVVGVMPSEFRFPEKREIWAPKIFNDEERRQRADSYFNTIGRLKPDITLKRAQEEMNAVAARLARLYPETNRDRGIALVPLNDQLVSGVRHPLLVFVGAVGLVLLIACANIANLLLARGAQRSREFAIRSALGAVQGRLIRQMLTESVLLGLLGGAAGILLAVWGLEATLALTAEQLPRVDEIRLDGRVLGFAFLVSLLTALLFGLAPAIQFAKPGLQGALNKGGRTASSGFVGNRLRQLLVVTEVGLALVLLIGAGLLIRSFVRLLQVNPGFAQEGVLALQVFIWDNYPKAGQRAIYVEEMEGRIASLPGVVAVGIASRAPLIGIPLFTPFTVEGRPQPKPGQEARARFTFASVDYFRTMSIPLRRGRVFMRSDNEQAPPVALINESFARTYFPGEDPLGKKLRVRFGQPVVREIAGIVGDFRHLGLESQPQPELFVPHRQHPFGSITFLVRTSSHPQAVLPAIKNLIWSLDKDQPIYRATTIEQLISDSLATRRFHLFLLASFAGMALLLASLGIYGLVSFVTNQRTHEVGVRMAMGARPSDIVTMVLGEGVRLAGYGVMLGLGLSWLLTRFLQNLLFEIGPGDPLTFASVATLLLAVALVACYLPARRAARVDPMVALRYE
jgi:putative ABC transport system permease protein